MQFKKGQKKIVKRNGKVYEKLADHIGLIPTVIISPSDRDLISEGSSTRRKFIDGVIGQTDKVFLQHLMEYTKILSQRNALLKYFAINQTFDQDTLEIYNEQLVERSTPIYESRKRFMEAFIPFLNHAIKKSAARMNWSVLNTRVNLMTHCTKIC